MLSVHTPTRQIVLPYRADVEAIVRPPAAQRFEHGGAWWLAVPHDVDTVRLLRNLGLVHGSRRGKTTVYSLYDDHVARLLDEAVYHSEHLRLGMRDEQGRGEPGRRHVAGLMTAPAP